VLRAVAAVLTRTVRDTDRAFRMGGEEFVVLLDGADRTIAMATAERLRASIAERPVSYDGRALAVTASVGVAVADRQADGDALLAAADAALYQAKQAGRNRVVLGDAG
jgi:diguanylate cyclase